MATQTTHHSYAVLGKRHIRKDVPEKATGAAKYTADITFPDMPLRPKTRAIPCGGIHRRDMTKTHLP
jgi:hypothetical protein